MSSARDRPQLRGRRGLGRRLVRRASSIRVADVTTEPMLRAGDRSSVGVATVGTRASRIRTARGVRAWRAWASSFSGRSMRRCRACSSRRRRPARTQMLVEYCGGVGEALVVGRGRIPGRVAIDRPADGQRRRSRRTGWQRRRRRTMCRLRRLLLNDVAIAELAAARTRHRAAFGGAAGHRVDDRRRRDAVDRAVAADHARRIHCARGRQGPHGPARPASGRTPTSTRTSRSRSRRCSTRSRAAGYYHYFRNLGQRVRHLASAGCARWSRRCARSSACTARGCTTT